MKKVVLLGMLALYANADTIPHLPYSTDLPDSVKVVIEKQLRLEWLMKEIGKVKSIEDCKNHQKMTEKEKMICEDTFTVLVGKK